MVAQGKMTALRHIGISHFKSDLILSFSQALIVFLSLYSDHEFYLYHDFCLDDLPLLRIAK